MSTKLALWIVGGAAVALAVYYAFGAHATSAANDAGQTAASPPPQPVLSNLTRPSQVGFGAFAPAGRGQFFR